MSALSKIKLVEYHGVISRNTDGVYDIWIWETYDMTSELYIVGGQYIIDNNNNVYKIIDDSLDISYIKNLISR